MKTCLFFLVSITITASCVLNSSNNYNWLQFGGNSKNTGYYKGAAPQKYIKPKWKFKTKDNNISSLVVKDESLFFCNDNYLYSLDANSGEENWKYSIEGTSRRNPGPAIVGDEVIIGAKNKLYSIDVKTGQKNWSLTVKGQIWTDLTINKNEVFFASFDNPILDPKSAYLYAVNLNTHEKVWRFETSRKINSTPAVTDDLVLFGCDDSYFYGIIKSSGDKKWKVKTSDVIWSSPVVSDETAFFGNKDNFVYAIDLNNGQEKWKSQLDGQFWSGAGVFNGNIYIGTDGTLGEYNNYFYSINAETGQEQWSEKLKGIMSCKPVLTDSMVLVGSENLYSFNLKTGEENWTFNPNGSINTSPTIYKNKIFLGCADGYVYALE